MKLVKILDQLNSFEKNAFLKIVDNIVANNPKKIKEIELILSETDKNLKNVDNLNIAKVFNFIEDEYAAYLKTEFADMTSQLDVLVDIIIRDGNCIISREWFSKLYEKEIKQLRQRLAEFNKVLKNEKAKLLGSRIRDFKIYNACIETAYINDLQSNQDCKITNDEQSILITLAKQLELSQEEVKLINYSAIPIKKQDIDTSINDLRNRGLVFYSRKTLTLYVADEIVRILRLLRGKEVADKFFRRVLKQIKDAQLNLVCRKHNIDRKLPRNKKIKEIINGGISFTDILENEIYKDGTKATEKKTFITDLTHKKLKTTQQIRGATVHDKINFLIRYFEGIEKDEKVGISIDGYEKLLIELNESMPKLNSLIKDEFELQDENVLRGTYLIDYNIKPRDIVDIINNEDLVKFCKSKGISTRGNIALNVLEKYKDVENIYLENFENIGFRNLAALKENNIQVKEGDLGIKFENLT